MKKYIQNMEMITRQVEAEQETPASFWGLVNLLVKQENALKILIYVYLSDKIEEHHWQTNLSGLQALNSLQVKKLALAKYMGFGS